MGQAQFQVVARRCRLHMAAEQPLQVSARQPRMISDFVDANRVFDVRMHQLKGQKHPLGQAWVDLRGTGGGITHHPRPVARQHLLHRPA
ncbi:hypothetical protein D3C79_949770 [compost metagenome]